MIDMDKRLVHTSKQLQATILMTSMVLKLAHAKRQPVDTTSMTNMVKR
ncbi:unknown [Fusobacterium sp. CAG:439]|nr:unknown [Fusobacterium sp. CAG:439]